MFNGIAQLSTTRQCRLIEEFLENRDPAFIGNSLPGGCYTSQIITGCTVISSDGAEDVDCESKQNAVMCQR